MPDPAMPAHRQARPLLEGVVKRFGPITAVNGLNLKVPAGIVPRAARAQRRRQVDHDAHAHRPDAADVGAIEVLGLRRSRSAASRPAPRWASSRRSTTSTPS